MSLVYFIRPVGMPAPTKIGFSECPISRLRVFARWSPFPLEVVHSTNGAFREEQLVHALFQEVRTHHEWFGADPRIDDLIRRSREGESLTDAVLSMNGGVRPKISSKRDYSPSMRRKLSYVHRIRWAERRACDAEHWAGAPSSIASIMTRWSGGESRDPSTDEIAHLEEFLSDPAKFLILHKRFRRQAPSISADRARQIFADDVLPVLEPAE